MGLDSREEKFAGLLAANRRRLAGIARSYARGDAEQDLLQEILLQLWHPPSRGPARQIRLMRSLPWWYLAPILVGTNLAVFLTTRRPVAVMAIVLPLTIIVVAAVFWLNRRTLRQEMLPLRAELDRCLAGLTDEADS